MMFSKFKSDARVVIVRRYLFFLHSLFVFSSQITLVALIAKWPTGQPTVLMKSNDCLSNGFNLGS